MLKLICACFVLFTFSWSNLQGQTSAQPATNVGHSQEAVVFEQIKTKIDFENDGTGIRETTVRVRIQSEAGVQRLGVDRKSTRLNSSHQIISYAVFCLKKKIKTLSETNSKQI